MLVLFLIGFLFAQDDCGTCNQLSGLPQTTTLEWWAARAQMLASPICRTPHPTQTDMSNWLQHNQTLRSDYQLHGFHFKNESIENIKAFKDLIEIKDDLGRYDPRNQRIFHSQCETVMCAANELFGEQATTILYLKRQYGLNASHYAAENAQAWNSSELRDAIQGLLDFPPNFFPIWQDKPFFRYKSGSFPNASYLSSTVAEANLRFFDPWAALPSERRMITVVHEMGHALAKESMLDQSQEWKDLFQNHRSVSGYGSTSAEEEMAEAVVAYRYNPQSFKNTHPEKYEYIKTRIFDGLEFLSEESCRQTRNSTRLAQSQAQRLAAWQPDTNKANDIQSQCLIHNFSSIESRISSDLLHQCLKDKIARAALNTLSSDGKISIAGASSEPLLQARANTLASALATRMKSHLRGSFSEIESLSRSFCQGQPRQFQFASFINLYPNRSDKQAYADRAVLEHFLESSCQSNQLKRWNQNLSR